MILKIAMNKSHPGEGIWRIEKPDGTYVFCDSLDVNVPCRTSHKKSFGEHQYNGWIEADGKLTFSGRDAEITPENGRW